MYIYVCVCVCVCVYIYTHTYINIFPRLLRKLARAAYPKEYVVSKTQEPLWVV